MSCRSDTHARTALSVVLYLIWSNDWPRPSVETQCRGSFNETGQNEHGLKIQTGSLCIVFTRLGLTTSLVLGGRPAVTDDSDRALFLKRSRFVLFTIGLRHSLWYRTLASSVVDRLETKLTNDWYLSSPKATLSRAILHTSLISSNFGFFTTLPLDLHTTQYLESTSCDMVRVGR